MISAPEAGSALGYPKDIVEEEADIDTIPELDEYDMEPTGIETTSGFEAPEMGQVEIATHQRNSPVQTVKSRRAPALGPMPISVVKNLANSVLKSSKRNAIRKDTLLAIAQSTEWFFEQISEDLSAYADHVGRKTIDEQDMVMLMKRQRIIKGSSTPFFLAHRHLPAELVKEVRMSAKSSAGRAQR